MLRTFGNFYLRTNEGNNLATFRQLFNLTGCRGRTDRQGRVRDLMRGSVPRWVGIASDRRGRSADGAFYAADADVRETCASSRLSDGRTDAGDRAEEISNLFY